MHKPKLSLPSNLHSVPVRKFKLDKHSEYYPEDRLYMKQFQMLNFKQLYATYSSIIIFDMGGVRGGIISDLRRELLVQHQSELFVGKNTIVFRIIKEMEESNEIGMDERNALRELRRNMVGPICLLFTDRDILEMKRLVESYVTYELPKVGHKVTEDIYVEPGMTHLDPTATSNFAAFNVATKITKGRIEIVNRPRIFMKGDILKHTDCMFLKKLEMKPCKFGCKALYVFDKENHCMHNTEILEHDLNYSINEAMNNIVSITLECHLVNQISVFIDLQKGIYNILALEEEIENSIAIRTIENDDVD